jgi:integrase/recombinase XerD
LPRGIEQKTANALLRSCDRRQPKGRRDYAVLLTLLRLGLRAGEVAGLRLDDIDWRAGEVVVHGKRRHEDRLPLPSDVGEAVAAYLKRGRHNGTVHREVFLRTLAPIGPLGASGISAIVRHSCARAEVPVIGAHRLRHTLACQLARVPLPVIAEVLRHRAISTTSEYARVDVEGLRAVAQPWPGREGQ